MQRVNQYEFYHLATVIRPHKDIKDGETRGTHLFTLHYANTALRKLISNELVPLHVCREAALNLYNAIGALLPASDTAGDAWKTYFETKIDAGQAYRVTHAVEVFEYVFAAELQTLATYFVFQKGIFSTNDLIENAENAIPKAIRDAVTAEALDDWKQAGKCIVFELPTAAGFHLIRATEAVIRKYYAVIAKPAVPVKTKARNWGVYIAALKKCDANVKVVRLLEQIKDMDRNPLIHPEQALSLDEALTLWGVASGAIHAMVTEIAPPALSEPKQLVFAPTS